MANREGQAARREDVLRLTAEGWPAHEIARRLGVTERTVRRDRVVLGIAQVCPRVTPEQERLIAALVEDGAPFREIARTVGVSAEAIRHRHPGRGWTPAQVAAHGALMRRTGRHVLSMGGR